MKKRRLSRVASIILIGGVALVLTILLQQPAGAPTEDGESNGAATDSRPPVARMESQAQQAARIVWANNPVQGVEIAVRNGVALIAVRPEPGLTPEEHRALEKTIARQIAGRVEGINEAFVTTDSAMYAQVQQLDETRRDLERRVGTRTVESQVLWAREFDTVARQLRQMPAHAHAEAAAAAAGSATEKSD